MNMSKSPLFDPTTLTIDRDLLFRFFVVFSKFEFALKNVGFLKMGREERTADPDWDCFARSLKDTFQRNSSPELEEACGYLLEGPPMKQVVVDGRLAWSKTGLSESLTEVERVLLLVRRVRNNLVHGGKFSPEVFEDTSRQEQLLRSSLTVLDACLRLSTQVMNSFESAAI